MSPTFQKAWYKRNKMELPPHLTGSVKQASKEVKPSERVKKLQTKSLQAYGATKGLKVGGEHGSGEMKDTIAPLTRDQHSKVQAAARAAKAAEKSAAKKTPLTKSQRMSAIAAAVRKAQTKHDVPTMELDDEGHDDLRDVHQSLHIRKGTYSEATDRMALIKQMAAKNKMNKPVALTKKPETVKKSISTHKHYAFFSDLDYAGKDKKQGQNRFEEVENVNEASPMIKPPTNRFDKKSDAFAHAEKHGGKVYKQTYTDSKGQQTVSYSVKKEEVEMNEASKAEAEKLLGGPVKTRTGTEPKGKLPLGFRQARNLARKAMKTGKTVTESTTEVNEMSHGKKLAKMIMAKQSKHPIAQMMGEAGDEPKHTADAGEYDYEGDMAKSQLRSIMTNAKRLHDMLEDQTNLPEWVQSKITLAEDYVLTAANYMEGEMNEGYGGKFPKQWQKEMEKIPSTSTVVHKDKTVVTTKKDGKVVDVKTTKNEEVEQVDEKINLVKAKMGDVIKDFQKSDAPQFKGKSMEKRREMAIAAKLGAEREVEEEVEQIEEKYMGFKAVMAAAKKGGARNPAAVAASIGREKYGKEKFQAMAAKGKRAANEETEIVAEAEGSVPTTPKEKELAAHHGDPNKITYGDVIKARLKSAAAKKMGK